MHRQSCSRTAAPYLFLVVLRRFASIRRGCRLGRAGRQLRALLRGFGNANTGPITIGELNARRFECALQRLYRAFFQFVAPLKSDYRVDGYLGDGGKFSDAPSKGCTCHTALQRTKNHYNVPISVAMQVLMYIILLY